MHPFLPSSLHIFTLQNFHLVLSSFSFYYFVDTQLCGSVLTALCCIFLICKMRIKYSLGKGGRLFTFWFPFLFFFLSSPHLTFKTSFISTSLIFLSLFSFFLFFSSFLSLLMSSGVSYQLSFVLSVSYLGKFHFFN